MTRGLRATFRIARRDAMRHKVRSSLIVAMIAMPVLGLVGADVLWRTMQLSPDEHVTRDIGAADVGLQVVGGLVPPGAPPGFGYGSPEKVPPGSPAYRDLQARAMRIIGSTTAVGSIVQGTVPLSANGRRIDTAVTEAAYRSPLADGLAILESGRAPRTGTEVAVSPQTAQRLGVGIGDRVVVTTPGDRPVTATVTGVMRNPQSLDDEHLFADPAAKLIDERPVIVAATARPVTWLQVVALAAVGVEVESRYVANHPPAELAALVHAHYYTADRVGVATVAVGLAILEVVLLAGTAFAVGARRQRRDLALLGATGGDASDVVKVVLAGGVVLGAIGGIVGAAGGIVTARLALGRVAGIVNHAPGHFEARSLEILGIVLLGLLTGVIACVLPARLAARDNIVAALSGRRGGALANRKVPVVGLAMIVVGAVVAGQAAIHFHFRVILAGAALSELGFVACAPTVVGFVGRFAKHLPLAPRLALRDAARQRGRSGPAVAAVMAAIAGSVAVSCYFVSIVHRDRAEYRPQARIGQVVLHVPRGPRAPALARTTISVAQRTMGLSRVVPVRTVDCVVVRGHCEVFAVLTTASQENQSLAVGDAQLLRTLSGRTDAAAEAALAEGKLVAFSAAQPQVLENTNRAQHAVAHWRYYLDDLGDHGSSFAGVLSPAAAAHLHLGLSRSASDRSLLAVTPDGKAPSQGQYAEFQAAIDDAAYATVGWPYSSGGYGIGLVALAAAAAIVTLGATAISVGLSMAESKPDLLTLSAVGGRPLTRRWLVASQAGTVAVLGAVQGVVAGLIPAWAVLRAHHSVPFVMPWSTILVTVVALPVLAMAVTGLFAGTRTPVDRRAT
jgi:putative ABC transport system permease protein